MYKERFRIWIEKSLDLKEYSINRYVNGILNLDVWLKDTGMVLPSIYTINDINIINTIMENEAFIEKNKKENRMYSAALNHYKNFLEEFNDSINKGREEIEFANDVEETLLKIPKETLIIKDEKESVPKQGSQQRKVFKRNPKKSAESIIYADFKCEVDSNHKSFISNKTRENYCEGHHLVHMSKQFKFENSLDVHANIISLCPNCHRTLHHGIKDEKDPLLTKLYEERKNRLDNCGINITLEELLGFY